MKLALKTTKYFGPPDKPHTPFPKQMAFLLLSQQQALYGGAAGGAKVLYDCGEILTPFGFRKGIDLQVGDMVNAPDGSITKIIQLHERKSFQVWRVHFHDNTYTDVGREHLWLSWRSGKKKKHKNQGLFGVESAQVIETQELKKQVDLALRQKKEGKRPNWPLIPVCEPQSFNVPFRNPSKLDPYLLGMLLGDGSLGEIIRITSADYAHMRKQLEGYEFRQYDRHEFRLMGSSAVEVAAEINKLGLRNTASENKFVPKQFLLGSKETRLAVLQGLLDTNGDIDDRGHVSFSSCSKQLANDVAFLVRSLGGTAVVSAPKPAFCTKKTGEAVEGLPYYRVYIKHPDEPSLFRLERKSARCTSSQKTLFRQVVKVEVLKKYKVGRCITVAHPSGLYLTNDFIVTHNSDCLLMCALQYVDIPGYAALIIRRNITDLKLPGNLLDRANSWLKDRPEVRFDGSNHTFYFPTKRLNGLPGEPAKLTFGFLSKERSLDRYKGGEFQFIAFDELTQFTQEEYTYLISRLRKPLCPFHGIQVDPTCGDCIQLSSVPLRVRSATNPGDVGHQWVKEWFDIRKDPDGRFRGHNPERPFLPSFMEDNPYIDQESYRKSLEEQHPIIREQLLRGDWDISANARFRKIWARYYHMRGNYFVLEHEGQSKSFHIGEAIKVFATMDPAVSRKDYVVRDGKKRSHCVISVWALMPSYDLLLVGHRRFRGELDSVLTNARSLYTEFNPEYILIETNNMGETVRQLLAKNGIRTKGIASTNDKVTNAIDAAVRMSEGRIWFPKSAPYLAELEDEIFTWTGDENQQDDQVDSLSNAVREVSWDAFSQNRQETLSKTGSSTFSPFVY